MWPTAENALDALDEGGDKYLLSPLRLGFNLQADGYLLCPLCTTVYSKLCRCVSLREIMLGQDPCG